MSAKPPLVCVHGFTASPGNWDPVRGALEERFEVFTPALAGHRGGRPFAREGRTAIAALVDDLEDFLDDNGLDRVHLVGNSLGGWLVLELAARGRARSVVCLSPALGWEKGPHVDAVFRMFGVARAAYRVARLLGPRVLRLRAAKKMLAGAVLHRATAAPPSVVADLVADNLACTAFDDIVADITGGPLPLIDEPACPVAIVWSGEDALIPEDPFGVRFAALLPHATRRTLPGVGHAPMFDDPEGVVREIVAGSPS